MSLIRSLVLISLFLATWNTSSAQDCECTAQIVKNYAYGCAVISWPPEPDFIQDAGECDRAGCGEDEMCGWRSVSGLKLVISCPGAAGFTVCDVFCPIDQYCTPLCNTSFSSGLSTTLPLEVECGEELRRTMIFFDGTPQVVGGVEITLRCVDCLI